MTRLAFLLCAAALPACSSEPAGNETGATPIAPATFAPTEVAARPAASPDRAMTPRPGALKTFGDWTVGCDNLLACQLRSLGPESGAPGDVTMAVAREAGPSGKIDLTLDGAEKADLAVDGRRAGGPAQTLAAMADARVLTALTGGNAVATLSLKGASAALRYVDAVQGRAGTVTALVARGLKPARTVPAPPAAPTIVALASSGTPAAPTPVQVASMRRTAKCDAEALAAGTLGHPETHALGGGKTLVLVPCSSGAYNVLSAMFILDSTGVAPVRADAPVGFAETGADQSTAIPTAVNAAFEDGVLTSFAKGRGIGDCGVIQQFVWDGAQLRLSEQRQMGECRGNANYITTWRARVLRR